MEGHDDTVAATHNIPGIDTVARRRFDQYQIKLIDMYIFNNEVETELILYIILQQSSS